MDGETGESMEEEETAVGSGVSEAQSDVRLSERNLEVGSGDETVNIGCFLACVAHSQASATSIQLLCVTLVRGQTCSIESCNSCHVV